MKPIFLSLLFLTLTSGCQKEEAVQEEKVSEYTQTEMEEKIKGIWKGTIQIISPQGGGERTWK
jgi:hypothetical protein